MALNFNQVTLAGHLTRDPELKQISPDRVVAHTGIAINRRWKNSAGEIQEEATFLEVEAWGRTAELMGQFLKKGSPAFMQGRLKLDQWDTPEGEHRTKVKVVADLVQFLPTGQRDETPAAEPAPATPAAATPARPAPARPAPARRAAAATDSNDQPPF